MSESQSRPMPNFEDPDWDAKRIQLQNNLGTAAQALADHSGGAIRMGFVTDGGLIIEISRTSTQRKAS